MSDYRHDNDMETPGKIGLKVKAKKVENGFVTVTIGNLSSTMAPLLTNELERIAHSLRATTYVQQTTGTRGFPYAFPAVLGE